MTPGQLAIVHVRLEGVVAQAKQNAAERAHAGRVRGGGRHDAESVVRTRAHNRSEAHRASADIAAVAGCSSRAIEAAQVIEAKAPEIADRVPEAMRGAMRGAMLSRFVD